MPDDIVTRLRAWSDRMIPTPLILAEAADEIEQLRRRLHEQNEYSLRLQYELERLNAYSAGLQKALFAKDSESRLERQQQPVFHECKWCGTTNRCDR
jgi:hypothetical protein